MAKNQTRQTTEEPEPWIGDETADFEDDSARPATEAPPKAKVTMAMRNRIEDLLDRRRLQKQIDDYEAFELDDQRSARRTH